MNTIEINGHDTNYDDDLKEAMRYLQRLDDKETETLFDFAKLREQAFFQDNFGRHYILAHKNGQYFIMKR